MDQSSLRSPFGDLIFLSELFPVPLRLWRTLLEAFRSVLRQKGRGIIGRGIMCSLNPNSKSDALVPDVIIRSFELRHSFDIRHSGFVIFQKVLALAPAKL